MPKRATADLPFRSGRFKNLTAATQKIVKTYLKGAKYRFFNTSKTEFTVSAKPEGLAATTLTVKKQCSVDILVRANSTVTISPVAQVEGVFDLIDKDVPIRSGRFKASGLHPAGTPLQIIRGRSGDFYRFFNAGEHSFKVGGMLVLPECSTDFALADAAPLSISTDTDVSVLGVYDALECGPTVRTGHFKLDVDADATLNTELEHIVVDVTNCSKAMRYRITNSGKGALQFKVIADGTELATLSPDQSIDFVAGPGTGTDVGYKQVKIARLNKTILVTGVYDLLGEE